MKRDYSKATETARTYYNSRDADLFYATIWGGEDIHLGIYNHPDDPIAIASRRTIQRMAATLPGLDHNQHVVDLGAGFGGSARYLARHYGCRVTAVNLSETENERHRKLNAGQPIDAQIDVIDASFDDTGLPEAQFEVVWSQDAFLHSDAREKTMREATRLLKPGAHMVFTDPMQADDCPEGVLQPILDRIHLDSLASPGFYRACARQYELDVMHYEDLTTHLAHHYRRVLDETERREDELLAIGVSHDYIQHMKRGLRHWVEGSEKGWLAWGIFHLQKQAQR